MAIEVGNVFEGRVTGVKPFGAFVALPEGRVGMVHISEVSNEFVQDIAAVLHDGDTVKVQVINIAPDGKIALSIKRLLPPPPMTASSPLDLYSLIQFLAVYTGMASLLASVSLPAPDLMSSSASRRNPSS